MMLLGAGAAALTVAWLQSAASIIAPMFFALVITIAVHPLRGIVTRRGWPDWAGVVVGILAAYAVVIGLLAAAVYSIAKFATLIPQYAGQLDDEISSATAKLKDLGIGQSQVDSISGSFDSSKLIDAATNTLQAFLGLASNLTFVILLLLFLAMDAGQFPQKLMTNRGERGAVVSALESFAHGTRQYLIVSTVFGFIVAVLDSAFLYFTPVPEPLLWGLLAFITNYIPNIGFIIGLLPPAVLGLLEGGPGLMLLIIVVYIVLNFIIQSVIQPKFIGDAVGLSVSLTFLSLVFWAWVFGAPGAFLAVPLSLLTKALLVDVDRDSLWLKPLLAGGPMPAGGSEAEKPTRTAPTAPSRE
jgi:AI-2 transport protein TqsA